MPYPGFIYEAWANIDKPGIYRGQCAELCGINHGFMPIVVDAKREADFDQMGERATVAEQNPLNQSAPAAPMTKDELIKRTVKKFIATNCSACHKARRQRHAACFPGIKR